MKPVREDARKLWRELQDAGISRRGLVNQVLGSSGPRSKLTKGQAKDILRRKLCKFAKCRKRKAKEKQQRREI